ncbi:BAF_collapsed_G0022250.mRNA.1.CDS.1 [Saccharomyces cerevisiae]|nr:CFA_G0021880.mRNA.1.CDS.1 [Saccharomyces cerevisiae]CAI5278857.1 BAF_HP2_G0021660.mRNA.1.CDS.1 [Saccharomyces cerevisiae]CAI6545012.1 BAF_HP2_G0021660.mRNA.1.CDS.1 [Saccharomyces cerevisiae]CAI7164046.1 BAF_collapsed_G0022250.mRNA.1.CDS.1 [Saccharomyces cerevisiae]CAI7314427.1 CFA_G0021880.mRNA.1.CDS.1 [Saccharomyces cerevisiae]
MSAKQQLRILVPVKRVVDFQIKPRVNKTLTGIETSGIKFSINPFDDIAVEEAIRIKEKNKSLVESTHAVSIGSAKAQDILRNCLAKGIDTCSLIDSVGKENIEPLAIAKILKAVVEKEGSNLVLMGKQAIDDDCNNTGQMLAGLLNWPQATNAAKVEFLDNGRVQVTREIDDGEEVIEASLPMVITTDLRLNTPRYVGLPKLMKAKKKPIEKLDIAKDFPEINIEPQLKIVSMEEPKTKSPGVKLNSVDELIEKLIEVKAI